MKLGFATSLKFLFSNNRNKKISIIYIIIGVALGFAALITVMSVMNSLQSMQISTLRNKMTFDITVLDSFLVPDKIKQISGVENAYYYKDKFVIVSNEQKKTSCIANVRIVDLIKFQTNNSIDIQDTSKIAFSYYLFNILQNYNNNEFQLISLKKGRTKLPTPEVKKITFDNNLYFSDCLGFDKNYILIPLKLNPFEETAFDIAVTCKYEAINNISKEIKLLDPNAKVLTFEDKNTTLVSALKFEKIVVMILLFLVCIIVILNLKLSLNKLIIFKTHEVSILRVYGMSKKECNMIFYYYGFEVIIISQIIGIVISVFILKNFGNLMSFLGRDFLTLFNKIDIDINSIALFSIILFILSFLFIYSSCKKLHQTDLMEALIYESH